MLLIRMLTQKTGVVESPALANVRSVEMIACCFAYTSIITAIAQNLDYFSF